MENPETLLEAVRYFSDLQVCFDYMLGIKWPDGKIVCPKCDGKRIGRIATRSLLRCKDCRKQFSVKQGTIFEESPLGLDKWFVAVWCIPNAKNGISSCELGRALGITQKSAWFMLHRIRLAMRTPTMRKLTDVVESDETFIGGKASNTKRMIRGTYVAVAPFHLQAYLDEEAFRFNWRKQNDGERFASVMRCVLGKRITFRLLCAIDDAGFMGLT